jgi:hypothetical protein
MGEPGLKARQHHGARSAVATIAAVFLWSGAAGSLRARRVALVRGLSIRRCPATRLKAGPGAHTKEKIMSTLPTLSLIQSRIIELPNRPPLMLAAHLAEFYGVKPNQIGQQVSRNPDRFPDDFVTRLADHEVDLLLSQNVKASALSVMSRHSPLAFTMTGAAALSGVLKSPRADQVSVAIFRAWAEFITRGRTAMAEIATRYHGVASRYRVQRVARDPVARLVGPALAEGMDFAAIRKSAPKSWTTGFLVQGIHDMLLFGEIAELPAGTPVRALAQPAEG